MVSIIIYGILLLVCIVALIILTVNRVRDKNKSESVSSNPTTSINKSMIDLLPFAYYDEIHDCFILKADNSCMDLLQIQTKDLANASYDSVKYDIIKFTRLYKKYVDDFKIIATNFPSDTSEQQAYVRHKLETTNNEVHKAWLKKKLEELIWLEKNRTTREFYYMFWGKAPEEIIKNRNVFVNSLGNTKDGLISIIEQDKKVAIIRKLNNKNAMIMRRGEE